MAAPFRRSQLIEVGVFFLRLGATAFGGPAAHIGLMEQELVHRRQWLTREQFLDLVGACNLLPGPSSSQVAMSIGFHRGGLLGLVAAGVCFLLPSFGATLALAWAYLHYGTLPQATGLLYGTKPVMVAIVVQALWNLRRAAFPAASVSGDFKAQQPIHWLLPVLGIACLVASFAGVPPMVVLISAGVLALAATWLSVDRPRSALMAWLPGVTTGIGPYSMGFAVSPMAGLLSLTLVFLKLGVVVFGSGYVLLAFLKADLVDRLHWLTETQLLDAVTAGQITPGPVFTTATFIGYLLHGFPGAILATLAIFLPSFFMVALVGWLAPRIRRSRLAGSFLDGVNVAALALMAVVVAQLGRSALIDLVSWGLTLVSTGLLVRYRVNATWLILGGAVVGLLFRGLH